MKMLSLGNSVYLPRKGLPEAQLPQNRPEPEREAALGGPLERVIKVAWPNERLPDLVDQWLAESQPDVVFFMINEFWFNYRSVPALISRKFGPLGGAVSAVGDWAGRNRYISSSAIFQRSRRFTEERVGGDAHFEPDEVSAVSIDVLRRITRAEGPVPLVLGPIGILDGMIAPAFRAEGVRRREQVDAALQRFCDESHIEYWGINSEVNANRPKKVSTLADGIHFDAAGMAATMSYLAPLITEFLVKVQADARGDQRPL